MSRSLRAELKEAAEPRYQAMIRRFVPTRRQILGVRVPTLRKIAIRLAREGVDAIPLKTQSTYEEVLIAGMLLARSPYPRAILWAEIDAYLDLADAWPIGDTLAAELKEVKKDPEPYWNRINELLHDRREFHVRFAEALLLNCFIQEDYIDEALERLRTVGHPGRYARLGAAWALQRCWFAFPEKTLVALERPGLPNDIRRKAIQNIRQACRRRGKAPPL